MRSTLTETALLAAKPNTTLWDGAVNHFGIRIAPGGTKTFIVLLGSGRRHKIGRYPTLTLAMARAKAKRLLAERALGRYQPQTITWETALDEFLAHVARKNRPRTHQEYGRTL